MSDFKPLSPEEMNQIYRESGVMAPQKDGAVTEFGESFMGAIHSAVKHVGTTVEDLTGYKGMRRAGEEMLAANQDYLPYEGYEVLSMDPTALARTLGQGLGSSTASITAGAVGTLVGGPKLGAYALASTSFLTIFGSEVEYFSEKHPEMSQEEIRGLAMLSAIPQVALEVGTGGEGMIAKKGLTKIAKQFLGDVGEKLVRKYGTGAIEKVLRRNAIRVLGKQSAKGGFKYGGKTLIRAAGSGFEEGMEEVGQDIIHSTIASMADGNLKEVLKSITPVQMAESFVGGAVGGFGAGGLIGGAQDISSALKSDKTKKPDAVKTTKPGKRPRVTVKDLDTALDEQVDGADLTPEQQSAADELAGKTTLSTDSKEKLTPKEKEMGVQPDLEENYPDKHFEPAQKQDDKVLDKRLKATFGEDSKYTVLQPKSTKKETSLNNLSSFVKRLTGKEGYDTVFYSDNKTGDPDVSNIINGFVDHDGKKMYVNVSTGSEVNPVSIAGHEFAHQLKLDSPTEYNTITSLIEDSLDDDSKNLLDEESKAFKNAGITADNREEFYNNVIGNQFTQESFWNKVFDDQSTSKIQKITRSVAKVVRRMKSYLNPTKYADKGALKGLQAVEDALAKVVKGKLKTTDVAKVTRQQAIDTAMEQIDDIFRDEKSNTRMNKIPAKYITTNPDGSVDIDIEGAKSGRERQTELADITNEKLKRERDKQNARFEEIKPEILKFIEEFTSKGIIRPVSNQMQDTRERMPVKGSTYVKMQVGHVADEVATAYNERFGTEYHAQDLIDAVLEAEQKFEEDKSNLGTEESELTGFDLLAQQQLAKEAKEKAELEARGQEFIDEAEATPETGPKEAEVPQKETAPKNGNELVDYYKKGFLDNTNYERIDLNRMADASKFSVKQIEEAMERAIVEAATELNTFEEIVKLQSLQPNLSTVTGKSKQFQAYSTPITIAYAMQDITGALDSGQVYEPTGGSGMLVSNVDPKRVEINELWDRRAKTLKARGQYKTITVKDGATNRPNTRPDIVIANPPFGDTSVKGTFKGYHLTGRDAVISAQALESRKEDGVAAIIVGAGMPTSPDFQNNMKIFNEYLYHNYDVIADVIMDGALYRKQGTSFPTRMIVVGSVKTDTNKDAFLAPKKSEIPVIKTIEELDAFRIDTKNKVETKKGEQTDATQDTKIKEVPQEEKQEEKTGQPPEQPTEEKKVIDKESASYKRFSELERDNFIHVYNNYQKDLIRQKRSGDKLIADYTQGQLDIMNDINPEWVNVANSESARISSGLKDLENETNIEQAPDTNMTPEIQEELHSPEHEHEHDVSQNTEDPEAMPEPYDRDIEHNPEAPFAQTKQTPINDFQNKTRLVSTGKSLNTVTPKEFDDLQLKGSLAVQAEAGVPIDEYVSDALQYNDIGEMHKGLAAEQVEGIGKAINKIKKNKAIIISDQTGIGKGRQAAGVMRYAIKNGQIPIFFTQQPKLFSDMYFDGQAIGTTFNPLLVGGKPTESHIVDGDGNRIISSPPALKQKRNLTEASMPGAWSKNEHNAVFITYSQIQKMGSDQQSAILRLMENEDTVLILDESHKAAGESNTGGFIKSVLDLAKGTLYLSATYAKKVANFGVYRKTSLGEFEEMGVDLAEVFKNGGVPLQQIVAQALSEAGELVRREKDFSKVTFGSKIIEDKTGNTVKTYDKVASVLSELLNFNKLLQGSLKERDDMNKSMNIDDTMSLSKFGNVIHNYVNQLTLGLKANAIVEEAINSSKRGQKPFIGLKNTLESALNTVLSVTDDPSSIDYRQYLEHILDRYATITTTNPQGEEMQELIKPSDPMYRYYQSVKDAINTLGSIDMPLSPIDYIMGKLQANGITIGEVTGRTQGLNYTFDDNGEVVRNKQGNMVAEPYTLSKETRNDIVRKFNDGTYEALLINSAGSTGLSAHASEEFKDQRQRFFILGQPDGDINVVMQAFGRVLRTGQVNQPEYMILSSELVAEKKVLAVLMKKLNSLTANTTGEQESSIEVGETDMMNMYGDLAAFNVIAEYPEFSERVGIPNNATPTPDGQWTNRFMGRIAILPNAVQEELMDALEAAHSEIVAEAKTNGTYSLKVAEHPEWEATTLQTDDVVEGRGGNDYFSQGVVRKKIAYKTNFKSITSDSVTEDFKKNSGLELNRENFRTFKAQKKSKLYAKLDAEMEVAKKDLEGEALSDKQESIRRIKRNITEGLDQVSNIVMRITGNDNSSDAVLTDIKWSDKGNLTTSKIKFRFKTNGKPSTRTLPLTQIVDKRATTKLEWPMGNPSVDSTFTGEERIVTNERYVYTGNMILAVDSAGEGGQIVRYSDSDGTMHTGYAMGQTWVPENASFDPTSVVNKMSDSDVETALRQGHDSKLLARRLPGVTLYRDLRNGNFIMNVPNAKVNGEQLAVTFEDMFDMEFKKISSKVWRKDNISGADLSNLIAYMKTNGPAFVTGPRALKYVRNIDSSAGIKGRQVNPVTFDDKARAINDEALDLYEPERIVLAEEREAAQEFIEKHGVDTVIGLMAKGKVPNDGARGTIIAKEILNTPRFWELYQSGNMTAIRASEEYRKQGTTDAQKLGARRIFTTTAVNEQGDLVSIMDYMAHLKQALMAPVKQLRTAQTEAARKKAWDKYENPKYQQALDDLYALGIDMDTMTNEDFMNDPQLFHKAIQAVAAAKASLDDKMYEYWINGLLSLPSTNVTNIVGNTAFSFAELVPQRFTEAVINGIFGKKDNKAATFGEMKYMLSAFKDNMKKSMLNAWDAIKTEGYTEESKLERRIQTAIRGKKGKLFRIPGNLMNGADIFAKGLITPVESSAMAYRLARMNGMSTEADIKAFMKEELANPSSESVKYGKQRALELTFQDPGAIVKWVTRGKNLDNKFSTALKYAIPFTSTPSSILTKGTRKSPLGLISLMFNVGNLNQTADQKIKRVSEQIIGLGMTVVLMEMVGGFFDDDDEALPLITGTSGEDFFTSAGKWEKRNLPPLSIRLGDTWYSYSRIEPMATSMGVIIDMLTTAKQIKNDAPGEKIISKVWKSLGNNALDKTFTKGLYDIFVAVNNPKRATNIVSNYVSSWVPNVIRGTLARTYDEIKDTKPTGRGLDYFKTALVDRTFQRALGNVTLKVPKHDMWGNVLTKDDLGTGEGSSLFKLVMVTGARAFSPIQVKDAKMSKPDQLLYNYNQKNLDKPYFPSKPLPYYTYKKKRIYIDDREVYAQYDKRTGQIAKEQVEKGIRRGTLNYQNPDSKDIKKIREIFKHSRAKALKEVKDGRK